MPSFDYSQAGAYFVTIVTHKRELLFEDTVLTEIVQAEWEKLPTRFPALALDAFVVMPNHVHAIIIVTNGVGAIHELPLPGTRLERRLMLLPRVIGYFKIKVAKNVNRLRDAVGAPAWQRNYFEHIVRSEEELNRVREYVHDNPANWALDKENPVNQEPDEQKDWQIHKIRRGGRTWGQS